MADQSQKAQIFDLSNGTMHVKISNYDATIISLSVPGKDGKLADVVLGFDTLQPYLNGEAPYFGCIVDLVANRIMDGKFTLDGTEYSLPLNKPPNSLHGGHKGFDKRIWEVVEQKTGDSPSITFKYYSQDGEEGIICFVHSLWGIAHSKSVKNYSDFFRLVCEKRLSRGCISDCHVCTNFTHINEARYGAVPENKATPINLAQHTYWNLAGHNSGNILDHTIQLLASHITPVDKNTVPTGEIQPIKGTPFDFTTKKKIGTSIQDVGIGYDHNYVIDATEEKSGLKHVAKLKDPSSSRVLNLWSNAPGVQFYTANYVNGIVGKGGAVYNKHSGVCLETQGFPNAINQPNFPNIIVKPGEKYKHSMFQFSNE